MTARCSRMFLWIAAAIALAALARTLPDASAAAPYSPNDPAQTAAYERALSLGTQAYVYGYPLLDTNRVFQASTSVTVSNGAGAAPVNQLSNFRALNDPNARGVVSPNHDTLNSTAWLDLVPQPIVIHMPVVKGRFADFELLDPYTENFANIGSVGHPPGDYAIVPPDWHGRLPRGVKKIRSPYSRVWVIGRTYIKDAADTPNVVKIQNQYSLTPLDKWRTRYTPPRPRRMVSQPKDATIPGTATGTDPLSFFDALGDQLKRFPPPTRDRPLLKQLAAVGIGPARHPSREARLGAATLAGLRAAVAAGSKQVSADVTSEFVTTAPKHDGWLVAPTGSYGANYVLRAVADAVGLGASVPAMAIYPFTVTDSNLQRLTGANRYVVHFSRRYLPFPVKAFWSLTMYDSQGYFVPNSAGIYLVNNRSKLHYNADGTLDIYVQPDPPGNALQRRNWLPSPAGQQFRLILRLYEPTRIAGILSGTRWQPPTVLPCQATGATSAGTACAGRQ